MFSSSNYLWELYSVQLNVTDRFHARKDRIVALEGAPFLYLLCQLDAISDIRLLKCCVLYEKPHSATNITFLTSAFSSARWRTGGVHDLNCTGLRSLWNFLPNLALVALVMQHGIALEIVHTTATFLGLDPEVKSSNARVGLAVSSLLSWLKRFSLAVWSLTERGMVGQNAYLVVKGRR